MDCSRTALGGGTLKARPVGRCAHCTLVWETPVSQPIQHGAATPTAPAAAASLDEARSFPPQCSLGHQVVVVTAAAGLLPPSQVLQAPKPYRGLPGHEDYKSPALTTGSRAA